RKYPNPYGLANPAIFPMELMNPTAAAAIAGRRISVGSDQNTARYAFPAVTTVSRPITVNTECDAPISPNSPTAATSIGIEMCQRRSIVLSECQPFNGISTKQKT